MSKNETELVLVETVSLFRMRYVIEVPKEKVEWALDDVTCKTANEFSQKHLDETIVSHRLISKSEALDLCDKDNSSFSNWTKEKKVKTFFTMREDQDGQTT